jgi:hypothetical protein
MKSAILAGMVLFSIGCSGGDDAKPVPCSGAHRTGTFIAHFVERAGGTCGHITDTVTKLDSTSGQLAPGCMFDDTDTGSVDQCSLTRAITCPLDGVPGTVSLVAVSTEHDGGKSFTGTTTSRIYDGNGTLQCVSTYDVTWTRQ